MRGCFAVLNEHRVAYLDYTGSGAETIAHLRDNGRITLLFCAFAGPPKIVRLHGRGEVVLPGDARFGDLCAAFGVDAPHGLRSVIAVDVDRVSVKAKHPEGLGLVGRQEGMAAMAVVSVEVTG